MRMPMISLRTGLLAATVLGFLALAAPAQVVRPFDHHDMSDIPGITVTGTGHVEVPPDRCVLRLGAVAQADTADAAQSQVNDVVQKTLDSLRDAGLPKNSIRTTGITLSPVYSQPRPSASTAAEPFVPRIVAYRATNTIEIRLTDLTKVGAALDAAVKSGTNDIQSLNFDLQDETQARQEALRKAVAQARAKADAIAQAMNLQLAGVQDVSETVDEVRPIPMMARAMSLGAATPTPVQPGLITVSGSVTLRYRIHQPGATTQP